MYEKRIKIFIAFSLLLLTVYLVRLAQMQLLTASSVQNEIDELKRRKGKSEQFKTLRGKILDRKGKVLAVDQARFRIHIDYELSRFKDPRVCRAMILRAEQQAEPETAVAKAHEKIREKNEDLDNIIKKCAEFKAVERAVIEEDLQKINDRIWNKRLVYAWRKAFPNSEIRLHYDSINKSVPISEAREDFQQKLPDPNERLELIAKADIIEMHESNPLLELKTDDDIFAAQFEFMDTEGVHILPSEQRIYPYGSVAAQTIGWVGVASGKSDEDFFAGDKLASYQPGELCGKSGVEYVCEAILRGRRGEIVKDIDDKLQSETETQFGKDVRLTLDVELQQDIEYYLTHCKYDPNLGEPNVSAVVIDVASSDILALVSLPVYDLNRVRYDWDDLNADPNKPMKNRAINALYPPGSVIKPVILIAGLEEGVITPDDIIHCPHEPAPAGWPNCLMFRLDSCHDWQWQNSGGNTARNAIKGSCNIYFSRLADAIDPNALQQWLFRFGYGQRALSTPYTIADANGADLRRNFSQAVGEIASRNVWGRALSFEEIPPLRERERRLFGIGQGNLRVTPLQVANSMATIARRGIFKLPRLLFGDSKQSTGVNLGISPQTLDVVYDGMRAVVNESGGTAYKQFVNDFDLFESERVKVYGKTGSTEKPYHAWFAGFAVDTDGDKIAVAVIVEGGEHGSRDAAPLARDIIKLCIQAGYLGKAIY